MRRRKAAWGITVTAHSAHLFLSDGGRAFRQSGPPTPRASCPPDTFPSGRSFAPSQPALPPHRCGLSRLATDQAHFTRPGTGGPRHGLPPRTTRCRVLTISCRHFGYAWAVHRRSYKESTMSLNGVMSSVGRQGYEEASLDFTARHSNLAIPKVRRRRSCRFKAGGIRLAWDTAA